MENFSLKSLNAIPSLEISSSPSISSFSPILSSVIERIDWVYRVILFLSLLTIYTVTAPVNTRSKTDISIRLAPIDKVVFIPDSPPLSITDTAATAIPAAKIAGNAIAAYVNADLTVIFLEILSLISSDIFEIITSSPLCKQINRLCTVWFYLLTETSYVNIHCSGISRIVIAPYKVKKIFS